MTCVEQRMKRLGTIFPPNAISGLVLKNGCYFSSPCFPVPKLLLQDSQVKWKSWLTDKSCQTGHPTQLVTLGKAKPNTAQGDLFIIYTLKHLSKCQGFSKFEAQYSQFEHDFSFGKGNLDISLPWSINPWCQMGPHRVLHEKSLSFALHKTRHTEVSRNTNPSQA